MLYQVFTRMIERGALMGLAERVKVLYAVGDLTTEEFTILMKSLN